MAVLLLVGSVGVVSPEEVLVVEAGSVSVDSPV